MRAGKHMRGGGRHDLKRFGAIVTSAVLFVGVVFLTSASATGSIGTAAGFEDDDGNLAPVSLTDWNSFSTVTWSPSPSTTPTRQATDLLNGFQFLGIEDWQATTSDSAFAGGTKQDDDCASVITAKADNKADLKRIYIASKTGTDGHTYLELAWVRIPQNTTSPSAHVAFEFNQGDNGNCAAGSGGLVKRSTSNGGDMLIVYDFEGGSTDTPHITLRRWVGSGACEISNDTAPCWGPAVDLTSLTPPQAEAKVNTFGSVSDSLAPPALSSTTGTSTTATLGTNEFGEAGVDLTAAGVFSANVCSSFGQVHGVSRTSGNSGTAQMKDLVGPAPFTLTNCGTVKIIKQTDPRGLNQNFGFTSTLAGDCTSDTTPVSFTLNDNGNSGTIGSTADADNSAGNTETCTNVPAGSYTVTEGANPTGFAFESLTCSASGTGTSVTPTSSTSNKTASITMAGGGSVTCVYVNKQQLGAIKITKTSSKTGDGLAGAKFSVTSGGSAIAGSPFTTDANGEICVDNLPFGDYVVTETDPPTGYSRDDTTGHTVTVNNNASCSDATYVGETIGFTDTPLADIQVRFRDGGSGETSLSQALFCDNTTGTSSSADTTGWDDTLTVSGVKVDSSTVTITCTIVIDP